MKKIISAAILGSGLLAFYSQNCVSQEFVSSLMLEDVEAKAEGYYDLDPYFVMGFQFGTWLFSPYYNVDEKRRVQEGVNNVWCNFTPKQAEQWQYENPDKTLEHFSGDLYLYFEKISWDEHKFVSSKTINNTPYTREINVPWHRFDESKCNQEYALEQ